MDADQEECGEPCGMSNLLGAPPGWSPPTAPDDFVYQAKHGAPLEEDINNPGGWSLYSFQPRYKSQHYIGHFTPTGAQVVPLNSNNQQVLVIGNSTTMDGNLMLLMRQNMQGMAPLMETSSHHAGGDVWM